MIRFLQGFSKKKKNKKKNANGFMEKAIRVVGDVGGDAKNLIGIVPVNIKKSSF